MCIRDRFKNYAAIWFCVVKKVESRYETLLILIFDVHHGVQQVLEVYESTCNRFLFKNNYELRFQMALKNVLMVHDELLLVLVVDVHHGDQNVPEVPETNRNQFLFKNCSELMYHIAMKKVLVVNDELLHVLVVDVHHGVQHDPEVTASTC